MAANEYDLLLQDEEKRLQGNATGNEYDGILASESVQDSSALRGNLIGALDSKPDLYAQAKEIERYLGTPAPVVERNFAEAEKRYKIEQMDHMLRDKPALAAKYRDPEFAKLAHDRAKELAQISVDAALYGSIKPSKGPEASFSSIASGILQAVPQGLEETRQGIRQQLGDFLGFDTVSEDAATKAARVRNEIAITMPEFESSTARGAYAGGVSLIRQVPALAASILLRNPNISLGVMGVQTEAEAYSKYRARGATGGEAILGAVGEGATEVITEKLAMGFLVEKFGKVGAGEFLAGLAAREVPGEQVATFVQDAIDTAVANPNKTWEEFFRERPQAAYETLVATLTQAGAMGAINTAVMQAAGLQPEAQSDMRKSDSAIRAEETITKLVDQAQNEELLKRAPDELADLINQSAGEGEVFINARQLMGVLNQDPIQIATIPGAAEQLDDALAANGDIKVNVGDFVTAVAQNEALRPLIEHARTEASAMSPVEARLWQSTQGDKVMAEFERVKLEKEADTTWQESAKQVEDFVFDQLQNSKRFTESVNRADAKLHAAFAAVYAHELTKAGQAITPFEFFQQHTLRVISEDTQAGQRLDQKGQLRTDTPEFKTWFGDSKVVDADGKPLVVYHGTNADLTEFGERGSGVNGAELGGGIYLTNAPKYAEIFGKIIMPVYIKAEKILSESDAPKGLTGNKLKAWALSNGYDAIRSGKGIFGGVEAFQIVVFRPEQIKSVNNRGTFDPNDPNILNQSVERTPYGRVIVNPSSESLANLIEASEEKELRGLRVDGDLYVWDSVAAIHGQMQAELGLSGSNAQHVYFTKEGEEVRESSTASAVFNQSLLEEGSVALRALADEGNSQAVVAQSLVDRGSSADAKDLGDVLVGITFLTQANRLGSVPSLKPVLAQMRRAVLDEPKVLDAVVASVPVDVVNDLFGSEGAAKVALHNEAMNENSSAFDADLVIPEGVDTTNPVGLLVREAALVAAEVVRRTFQPAGKPSKGLFAEVAGGVSGFRQDDSPKARAFFDPSTNTIGLLQRADLSSFLHESAHYFLEVMGRVAMQPDAPPRIRADFEAALTWMGVEPSPELSRADTWALMDLEQKREHHERFARGFENYLFEGKSPSIELDRLFSRFRAWLKEVYKKALAAFDGDISKALNVKINDEIRSVFDRMLATDEQIKQAEAARRFAPVFQTKEQAEEFSIDWEAYQRDRQQSTDDAVADVQAKSLRDMKWLANARGRKLKEMQKAAQHLRAIVEMDVRREVMTERVYQAWQFLTGKPEKSKKPKAQKSDPNRIDPTKDSLFVAIAKAGGIDKDALTSEWGIDPADIKLIPRKVFGKPVVRASGSGESLDGMLERLGQYGYFDRDENGKADLRQFEDAFNAELRGDEVFSSQKDYADLYAQPDEPIFDPEEIPYGKLNRQDVRNLYGNMIAEIAASAPSGSLMQAGIKDSLTTDSAAFRKWFGDSKVVDAEGKPLVVYHGTDALDFDAFRPGSFFSTNKSEASAYTNTFDFRARTRGEKAYRLVDGPESLVGTKVQYRGILSDHEDVKIDDVVATDNGVFRKRKDGWDAFQNITVDYDSFDNDEIGLKIGDGADAKEFVAEYGQYIKENFKGGERGRVLPVYLSIKNPVRLSPLDANRLGLRLGASEETVRAAISKYEAEGYDGIITESDEASMSPELAEGLGGVPTQYIAFRPEQIKSAIGNRGTYDPNDPNILNQPARDDQAPKRHPIVEHLESLKMLADDGYSPDMVADFFGFASGDDMMRQLAVAQPPKEEIARRLDERMLSDHAELATPEAIQEAADKAIHNEARSRVLARELAGLRKATGTGKGNDGPSLMRLARSFAEGKIARMMVRDAVKPGQHTAAEVRAGNAVIEAMSKADLNAAAQFQRDRVLNNELARAAMNARDEVQAIRKFFARFDNKGTRLSIDADYRDQIDQLLERFDFKPASQRDIEKRTSLLDWIAKQAENGIDPVVDRRLVERAERKHYSMMTMEELRGLKDTVENIAHLGRLKNRLLTAKRNRNLRQVQNEIAESTLANGGKDASVRVEKARGLGVAAEWLRRFAAEHRKVASLAYEMDGFKTGGPMWEYFVRPMNDAGAKEATMNADLSLKLGELSAKFLKDTKLGQKEQVLPGISLSREGIISMVLNWGNAGNRQRLMDGGFDGRNRISEAQVLAVLDKVTAEEWQFVQGVWDLMESMRPAVAEQEKRLTGTEPQWIEATPVVTKFGTFRGGYYPAKYDADLSTRSNELEAVTDLRQAMKGAAGNSATRKGYTEARAGEVKDRPLRKDFDVITQHFTEVSHRLAWQDWMIDVNRIMKAGAPVDQAIRQKYGPEVLKQLKDAIKDIAQGDIPAQGAIERGLNHARNGVTIAGMGWNVMTGLTQVAGFTQSIVRIGWVPMAKGLRQFLAHPLRTGEEVDAKSEFMRNRAQTQNREINDVLNRLRSEKMSKVEATYFLMIQKMQRVVDVPTWWGAYEDAVATGNDEQRAAALADQAVLDSQGGGQIKDLAKVQRYTPAVKLFTAFYSYFNTTYQLAVERGKATDYTHPLAVGKLAVDYLMLFTVPVVLVTLMKEGLKGGDDDEDKLAEKLAREQLNYLMGTMIGVRELGSAITGFQGYSGPAGTRFFSEAGKFTKQIGQGEVDIPLVKSAINVAGIVGVPGVGQFPSGQVNRTIEGIVSVSEGKAGPQAVIFGPPMR